jgi:hypothetical protein
MIFTGLSGHVCTYADRAERVDSAISASPVSVLTIGHLLVRSTETNRESAAALRGAESATHLGTIVTPWRRHSGNRYRTMRSHRVSIRHSGSLVPRMMYCPSRISNGITRLMIVASDNRAVNPRHLFGVTDRAVAHFRDVAG